MSDSSDLKIFLYDAKIDIHALNLNTWVQASFGHNFAGLNFDPSFGTLAGYHRQTAWMTNQASTQLICTANDIRVFAPDDHVNWRPSRVY